MTVSFLLSAVFAVIGMLFGALGLVMLMFAAYYWSNRG